MYKYIELTDKNNLGLLGIVYDRDCNKIDFSAIFKHDSYFSITNNSLNLPKKYRENEIIDNIIDNINEGVFDTEGTSISGSKEQIISELKDITGLTINI